jgi:DNA-binding transcriptional LysR family regulator
LSSTRLVLCASPSYVREHGAPSHPAELASRVVIAYTLLLMGEHWEFEGPRGPVAVTVPPRMRANSGETCMAAALAHQGIVLQPSFLVGAHLKIRCTRRVAAAVSLDRTRHLRGVPDAQTPDAEGALAD